MMYIKRLFRSGQVSIPKEFQKQLNINEGHYLFIYHCNNSIVIEKDHHNKTLNQCIFRKGKVSIPIEIRNLMGIQVGNLLKIQIKQDKLILLPLHCKDLPSFHYEC